MAEKWQENGKEMTIKWQVLKSKKCLFTLIGLFFCISGYSSTPCVSTSQSPVNQVFTGLILAMCSKMAKNRLLKGPTKFVERRLLE
jgi:hypothetical protein